MEFAFQDESRFGTISSLGRAWKTWGRDFEVKTKTGRESLYLFGMVTPEDGRLFTQDYDNSNTEAMNDFLRKILRFKTVEVCHRVPGQGGMTHVWQAGGPCESCAWLPSPCFPAAEPNREAVEEDQD
ncbi:MAG: transposase [Victivallales bacterium]|nr:transposase [Victivallales bacterium]